MANRGLPPGVHRKRAKGHVYYYFDTGARRNGKPVLKRLPDIGTAQFGPAYSAALSAKSRTKSPASTSLTVGQMLNEFERSPEFNRKADSTQRTYLLYGKTIRENMGNAPAEDLNRGDVLRLRDKMADRPGAANMTVSVIASLYAWGRDREMVTINPTKEIVAFDSTDYEPWPEALLEAALVDPDKVIRTSVALLYFTAQRIGDTCAIRWSDIRDGIVYVKQQKTDIELEIPVHQGLSSLLGSPSGITVLINEKGRKMTPGALRHRITKWASDRGEKVVPHGLRKNAVNALLEAGCSSAETSAISGQSLQMIEHYARARNRRKLAGAAILRWENTK